MNRPALGLACLLALMCADRSAAQRVAVAPPVITVGDVFRITVQLEVPPDRQVTWPDTLDAPPDMEAAARREIRIDTTRTGTQSITATYAMTAWRPGRFELPPARLGVVTARGDWPLEIALPALTVRSVLPADTAGVQPMPAKDVLGPDRLLWPGALAAVLVLALLAAAILAWRRHRRPLPDAVETPALAPLALALLALDRLLERGLLEHGDIDGFYVGLTGVLRRYVAAVEPACGTDLTTSELGERFRAVLRDGAARRPDVRQADLNGALAVRLDTLLVSADLVKFARRTSAPEQAREAWLEARRWIETYDGSAARGEMAA
jgi:hypothetical protein